MFPFSVQPVLFLSIPKKIKLGGEHWKIVCTCECFLCVSSEDGFRFLMECISSWNSEFETFNSVYNWFQSLS